MMATPKPDGTICDPGPCDPGAITEVLRDFGALPLLVFAAVAFVAGRKASRANLLLPSLTVAAIAAAFCVGFSQKMKFVRLAVTPLGEPAVSAVRWAEAYRWEIAFDHAAGFLVFALVPFGLGFLFSMRNSGRLNWRRVQP